MPAIIGLISTLFFVNISTYLFLNGTDLQTIGIEKGDILDIWSYFSSWKSGLFFINEEYKSKFLFEAINKLALRCRINIYENKHKEIIKLDSAVKLKELI